MSDDSDKANILIVDDDPSKLLALETILAELGENVVRAHSGKDALRSVLGLPFAVILLDINMPGMDGFETAELIRTHPSFRRTPLIFVTAYGDELYAARSYSLGAVDYILTPIVPEALRSKVRVFVDLFRSTERIRKQAETLRVQGIQLQKLAAASVAVNAAPSLEDMLKAIAEAARGIVGVNAAVISVDLRGDTSPDQSESPTFSSSAISCSAAYSRWRALLPSLLASDLTLRATSGVAPVRMSSSDLTARPDSRDGLPPIRSWLAVSLASSTGCMGAVQLIDKLDGSFNVDDEAILVQLAQMASMAIQTYVHAEAREANRLKDLFLATLSHELRTPLNVILTWARLLSEDPTDTATVTRGLVVIERNVRAQLRLVEDLLDVSRISSGKLQLELREAELGPVVEGVALALRPAAQEKQVEVRTLLDAPTSRVRIDADRMRQVVSNLVSNAIKFTPPNGQIAVEVREADAFVELTVRDTGAGITSEFLPFVFDRFQQADSSSRRRHGGLGLGLTVVRDLVELHGGSVHVTSAGENLGATFVVRLPVIADSERPDPAFRASRGPVNTIGLAGLDIVLVEDDNDTREIIATILERNGAHVAAYASIEEGLDAIAEKQPNVVISDLAMPGRDGYDLIRELRTRAPSAGGRLPTLALSAHASQQERERALNAGFDRHAAKPIQTTELVALVRELGSTHRADEKGNRATTQG